MQDPEYFEEAVRFNQKWLAWLSTQIESLGLQVTPSVGNFLLMHFKDSSQAQAADNFLMERGLILRRVDAYGLPHALRLTVGTEEANYAVIVALKEFLK